MEEMDYDDRLNDLQDDNNVDAYDIDDLENQDRADIGHSHIYDNDNKMYHSPFRSWYDIRMQIADNFRQSGAFLGTLRSLGALMIIAISIPVTLARHVFLRDARPLDTEREINKIRAAEDLKDRRFEAKKNEKEARKKGPTHKQEQTQEKESNNQDKDYVKTNDKQRMTQAINSLRTTEEKISDKGEPYNDKKIAGISHIGYSPREQSFLFYGREKKLDKIPINSNLLNDSKTVEHISAIFLDREKTEFAIKEKREVTDENTIKMMKVNSSIKTGFLLSSIASRLDENKEAGKEITKVLINGHEASFITGEDASINVILDGKNKVTSIPEKLIGNADFFNSINYDDLYTAFDENQVVEKSDKETDIEHENSAEFDPETSTFANDDRGNEVDSVDDVLDSEPDDTEVENEPEYRKNDAPEDEHKISDEEFFNGIDVEQGSENDIDEEEYDI